MHYYKKIDITNLYGVNPRTVTRWIEEARRGQIELDLHEVDNKSFIAKTPKNQRVMSELAQERRKYLNKNNLKVLKPRSEFYEIYSEEQILELISGLDTHHEIPLKFSYFKEGAAAWDKYAQCLYEDKEVANTLTSTIRLLDANMSYFDTLFENYEQVNVIDVGVGNALPSKNLLAHLIEIKKLQRYVAIDISNEMLHIAERNFREWFGDKATFEGYTNDISFEPFTDVVATPPGTSINLILVFGGTLANFDAPADALKAIRKSMGRNDLFLYCDKLDSSLTREQFSIQSNTEGQVLAPRYKYVLNMLGIEESQYNVEVGFDEERRARYMRIRLKQAITLEFSLPRGIWRVDFNKADAIVVWHANHNSSFEVQELLYNNGFNPLQSSQTADHNYMLIVADLRKYGR